MYNWAPKSAKGMEWVFKVVLNPLNTSYRRLFGFIEVCMGGVFERILVYNWSSRSAKGICAKPLPWYEGHVLMELMVLEWGVDQVVVNSMK